MMSVVTLKMGEVTVTALAVAAAAAAVMIDSAVAELLTYAFPFIPILIEIGGLIETYPCHAFVTLTA